MDYDSHDEDMDLEELEVALYSQVHYETQIDDIREETESTSGFDFTVTNLKKVDKKDEKNVRFDKPRKNVVDFSKSELNFLPVKDSLDSKLEMSSKKKSSNNEKVFNLCEVVLQEENDCKKTDTKFTVIVESDSDDDLQKNLCNKEAKEWRKDEERSFDSSGIEILSDSDNQEKNHSDSSVIEILSDSGESHVSISDDVNESDDLLEVYSGSENEDMLLDEEVSDVEGMYVNVEGHHQERLAKEFNFDYHRKNWSILDADKYGVAPLHTRSRYYGSEFDRCTNCRNWGHLSKSCPKPKKLEICFFCGYIGHYFRNCPQSTCYVCECPGHKSSKCTERRVSKWNVCYRCQMPGHEKKKCPEHWRQYHLTVQKSNPVKGNNRPNTRKYCYNCGLKGHFGYECEEDRMDDHSMPGYPFIAEYDLRGFTVQTASQRSIKRKLNEVNFSQTVNTPVKKLKRSAVNLDGETFWKSSLSHEENKIQNNNQKTTSKKTVAKDAVQQNLNKKEKRRLRYLKRKMRKLERQSLQNNRHSGQIKEQCQLNNENKNNNASKKMSDTGCISSKPKRHISRKLNRIYRRLEKERLSASMASGVKKNGKTQTKTMLNNPDHMKNVSVKKEINQGFSRTKSNTARDINVSGKCDWTETNHQVFHNKWWKKSKSDMKNIRITVKNPPNASRGFKTKL